MEKKLAAGSDRIFKRLKKEKRQMGCWDFFFFLKKRPTTVATTTTAEATSGGQLIRIVTE